MSCTLLCLFVMLLSGFFVLFFFKQKTAYEMRISDWSSDVCSSDLCAGGTGSGDDGGCFSRICCAASRDAQGPNAAFREARSRVPITGGRLFAAVRNAIHT